MAKPRRMIQVPVELAGRIEAIAGRYHDLHATGRIVLPSEFADHVPLHFVISKAIDQFEAHRDRARRTRRKGRATGLTDPTA